MFHSKRRAAVAALVVTAVAALAVSVAASNDPPAAATPVAPKAATAPADCSKLAFLAGIWQGDMDGSFVEEIWSAPRGTSLMGCFRWCEDDGKPAMFEMLSITAESDAIRLRLRHYTPTLNAKEDVDKPITLSLKECSSSRALFMAEKDAGTLDHIVYEVAKGELHIEVAFGTPKDGAAQREPLRFSLKRSG